MKLNEKQLAQVDAQVKPQFVETNKKAFAAGREAGQTDEA